MRCCEHKKSQRQKRQQSHVVCYQHGTDKSYVHKGKHAHAGVFKKPNYFACQHVKKVNVLQRTHNRKHAEQACQSFEIEIPRIKLIRRHKKHGYDRSRKRNNHYGIFLYKLFNR